MSVYDTNTAKSVLARYNLNGTLDTTFGGGDGMVDVPFNGELEIAPDGKLVEIGERLEPVEGSPDAEPQHYLAVARFTADGLQDLLDFSYTASAQVTEAATLPVFGTTWGKIKQQYR